MDNNQNTNPTEQQQFLLPTAAMDSEFTSEELAEDMDGMQMNFPRVKIPSGGALQYEIPTGDPDNPDYAKTLTGVIPTTPTGPRAASMTKMPRPSALPPTEGWASAAPAAPAPAAL